MILDRRSIQDLPVANAVHEEDLTVISQGGILKQTTMSKVGTGGTGGNNDLIKSKITFADSPFTAEEGYSYLCDTTNGPITCDLPSGVQDMLIEFSDYSGTWETNNLTLNRYGTNKICEYSENLICNVNNSILKLTYFDNLIGWQVDVGGIISRIGMTGASGYSGKSGHSGYSGHSITGATGTSGYSGIAGTNGVGTTGLSGYSGLRGYSGYSGIAGTTGLSGYSGLRGYSGYDGVSGYSGSNSSGGISYMPNGTGAVITTVQAKLSQVISIKDFGAVGNGVADDTVATQNFFNYVTANGGFGIIPNGVYLIKNTVTITLGTESFVVAGAGSLSVEFIAPLDFSGSEQVFKILNSTGWRDFNIGGFSIYPTGGGGTATIGLQIGDDSTGTNVIAGVNQSQISGIFVSDFDIAIKVVHTRMIKFSNCAVWNNSHTGAGTCLQIKQNGYFTSDLIFDKCQFVSTNASGNRCLEILSTTGPYNISNGNGAVSGIKFRSCDFYSGEYAIYMHASSSAWISDIWFVDGCQIDQEVTSCILAQSENSGSLIEDIHLEGMFFNKATANAVYFLSSGTYGAIKDIWVNDCLFWQPQAAAIYFSGALIQYVTVTNNNILDCSYTNAAIIFNSTHGIVCNGNRVRKDLFDQAPYYLLRFTSGCDHIIATGNDNSQITLAASILDESGDVLKQIYGNPGYNPIGVNAISVTGSPFTYKNISGTTQIINVTGGIVSNITINGVFGASITSGVYVIGQSQTITVTYSSTPTMSSIGV